MSQSHQSRLAVLLRSAQWELEDAAFHVGADRYSEADKRALADTLTTLARALRGETLQKPVTVEPDCHD